MRYEEFDPGEDLRHWVVSFWKFEAGGDAAREHTVVPDGTVSVVWASEGAALVGPRVTALRVPLTPGWEYWGVRFVPGVAGRLLGLRVGDLREKVVGLEQVAGDAGRRFAAAMRTEAGVGAMTAVVEEWAKQGSAPDGAVQELTRRIVEADGRVEIRTLCEGAGVSYRQLLRRFQREVGLSPKELARIRRIRRACVEALERSGNWAGIAVEAGYADQSHMGREFAGAFGWPPELVGEYLRRIEHRNIVG